MTAGGYENIPPPLIEYLLVFVLYYRRAYRGLLRIGKAERLKSRPHTVYPDTAVVRGKGWREADVNRGARLDKHAHLFGLVDDFLCVLRADDKALTAQNTFVAYYMRLISREAYRLHRAVAYTFVAVLAI